MGERDVGAMGQLVPVATVTLNETAGTRDLVRMRGGGCEAELLL